MTKMMFGLVGAGEVIGEIALLDGQARSATVTAVEATELLTLHRRELTPFLETNPRAAIELAGVLAARVRKLSDRAEDRQTMPLPGGSVRATPLGFRTTGGRSFCPWSSTRR